MRGITFKLPETTIESLDDEAEERGVTRSEYLRDIVESRHEPEELRDRIDELQAEITTLENRLDERNEQLRLANSRDDEVTELARFAEEHRRIVATKHAPITKRLKWWITGVPDDADREK